MQGNQRLPLIVRQLHPPICLTLFVVSLDAFALDHDEPSVYAFHLGYQLLLANGLCVGLSDEVQAGGIVE